MEYNIRVSCSLRAYIEVASAMHGNYANWTIVMAKVRSRLRRQPNYAQGRVRLGSYTPFSSHKRRLVRIARFDAG